MSHPDYVRVAEGQSFYDEPNAFLYVYQILQQLILKGLAADFLGISEIASLPKLGLLCINPTIQYFRFYFQLRIFLLWGHFKTPYSSSTSMIDCDRYMLTDDYNFTIVKNGAILWINRILNKPHFIVNVVLYSCITAICISIWPEMKRYKTGKIVMRILL